MFVTQRPLKEEARGILAIKDIAPSKMAPILLLHPNRLISGSDDTPSKTTVVGAYPVYMHS